MEGLVCFMLFQAQALWHAALQVASTIEEVPQEEARTEVP